MDRFDMSHAKGEAPKGGQAQEELALQERYVNASRFLIALEKIEVGDVVEVVNLNDPFSPTGYVRRRRPRSV